MPEREFVLVADKAHPGFLQRRQLLFGRPFPQSHVSVNAGLAISLRVGRRLQPDGERKEWGIGRWPFRPFRVRIGVQFTGAARGCQRKCDHCNPLERERDHGKSAPKFERALPS